MSMREMSDYIRKIHNRGRNWDIIGDEVESFKSEIYSALNCAAGSPKHIYYSKTYSSYPLIGYRMECEMEVYDDSIFAGHRGSGIKLLILKLLRVCAAGITKSYSFEFPLPNGGFLKFAIEYMRECETLMPGHLEMYFENPRIRGIAHRWCNNAERVRNIVFENCLEGIDSCIQYSVCDKVASGEEKFTLTFAINGQKYKSEFEWLTDSHLKPGFPVNSSHFAHYMKRGLECAFEGNGMNVINSPDGDFTILTLIDC